MSVYELSVPLIATVYVHHAPCVFLILGKTFGIHHESFENSFVHPVDNQPGIRFRHSWNSMRTVIRGCCIAGIFETQS